MTAAGEAEFAVLADRHRPELLAHCYRMLGSLQESEDLVQETYLRAWRYYDRFEGRSSVRLWLYKIATTTCLTALKNRRRRPLPSGLSAPSDDAEVALGGPEADIPWLQPAPDSLLHASTADPATVVSGRAGVRLAFVAALQQLSARQRAVLILRDVLGWHAREVAEMLDTSVAAVTSALQRARAHLAQAGPIADDVAEPTEPELRNLLDRYVAAFEHADVAALANLLRADVELEMPPIPTWFTGADVVCAFLAREVLSTPGQWRLIATRANGAPAFAVYQRGGDGAFHAYGVQVLSLIGAHVARINAFLDPGLIAAFDLPAVVPAPPATPRAART
ncbi:sigma-70 family RNA polymerase sigma factor [Amycolatopsis sp. DSM 110486]|uniref:sigma-70 family RNA polymerase sigma factor n=1 Tax=Amycolatopsis sp. DSM 110486 TaxID=2865832 RepID=UPI001C6A2861|nr:sigma-70 family RNA polymerase sigma factor [Amycolatopsis sp. DSM 110486]QYN25636.1 sigma-70 family RNA polymerase sigma factor [Amycolatopsis sp. DSM 110486]